MCRNKMILTDTELTKATKTIEVWKDSAGRQLTSSRIRLSEVTKALKSRQVGPHERVLLDQQRHQLNGTISALVEAKKHLDENAVAKRKALGQAKKKFKEVRNKKKKIDTLILVDLENIFKKKNISAAAYHGGKLNGVDCRELLSIAHSIFDFEIKPYLRSIEHSDRCTEDKIINCCDLHRDIFMTLDALTSIFSNEKWRATRMPL
jgi:hypothetical protein